MGVSFIRREDGWTDVAEVPDGWGNIQASSDDRLLAALALPMPERHWQARIVYLQGSSGYRSVRRTIEGKARGRSEAMEQIMRLYQDKRGFYVSHLEEITQPVMEESCRATVTI